MTEKRYDRDETRPRMGDGERLKRRPAIENYQQARPGVHYIHEIGAICWGRPALRRTEVQPIRAQSLHLGMLRCDRRRRVDTTEGKNDRLYRDQQWEEDDVAAPARGALDVDFEASGELESVSRATEPARPRPYLAQSSSLSIIGRFPASLGSAEHKLSPSIVLRFVGGCFPASCFSRCSSSGCSSSCW